MVRIAVASANFGSTFPGLMYGRIKKIAGPEQEIVECATQGAADPELARARLLGLLEGEPKPIALIGISIRPDPVSLAAWHAARAPIVLIDEQADGATTVAVDNYLGGYLAAKHLVDAGRRRIAIVVGMLEIQADMNAAARLHGFEKALAEKGLSPAAVFFSRVYTRKDGAAAMAGFLEEKKGIDAVFCAAGDVCAAGVLATAKAHGVKVPDDVAVIGFDDDALAAISDPPLTTIRQPLQAMADEAFRLATTETAAIFATPRRVRFEPELVVRASA